MKSNAWDGSGHQASAQQYSQSIFPDLFGWTDTQFGGLPFPNFYPPVFNWCLALLEHSRLFSFDSAFKLMVVLPVLLLPIAVWGLGRAVFPQSRLVAAGAMLSSLSLVGDSRFLLGLPAGLDYFSTFQLGLYTQPLGFVLLAFWYVAYLKAQESRWRFSVACVLLALTILSSFFSAVTAAVFIVVALASDLVKICRHSGPQGWQGFRARLISSIVGVLLAGIWLVPMASEYQYFVTRPQVAELGRYLTPVLWCWIGAAIAGGFFWWRQATSALTPYLGGCGLLAGGLVFSSLFSPGWFPLQGPRLLITLMVLLSVPAGFFFMTGFRGIAWLLGKLAERLQIAPFNPAPYTMAIVSAIVLAGWLTSPEQKLGYSFYPPDGQSELNAILQFARDHRDGRYLVEVPHVRETRARFDGRAINAYLSAQGNETLSSVYHEASVNSLFFLPVVNTFSAAPYHFGVSSILADDLDLLAQLPHEHLTRALSIGVRYLVIYSDRIKTKLSQGAVVEGRHDFAGWSVFELKDRPPPRARVLPYLPALVISSFTAKERRRNEPGFIRWAEEQFASGWFDVLLARSPESKIDRMPNLDRFGAVILDSPDCSDCELAFERLRHYAQNRPLILLPGDHSLSRRIEAARAQFPNLVIIDRFPEEAGDRVNSLIPTFHYNNSRIRTQWLQIRAALDRSKIPVETATAQNGLEARPIPDSEPIETRIEKNRIQLNYQPISSSREVPALIASTFHPNWSREDGEAIYAVTPFYMLTFVSQPATLNFSRRWYDRMALWGAGVTLLSLVLFTFWPSAVRRASNSGREP